MSTDTTLSEFLDVQPDEEDDNEEETVPMFADYARGETDGNTGLSAKCDHCGSQVSADFHRVFCDNDGNLHGCHSCMTGTGIRDGGCARGRDYLRNKGVDPENKL